VEVRFYLDPETGLPHIHRHDVDEDEVRDVLGALRGSTRARRLTGCAWPNPGRPIPAGDLRSGRSPELRVRDHRLWTRAEGIARLAASASEEIMTETPFPAGWDEARVRRVLEHYESQPDEEAAGEDEAAFESTTHTIMEVPVELVPEVRELLAKRRAG
jgi:hypothetical protein